MKKLYFCNDCKSVYSGETIVNKQCPSCNGKLYEVDYDLDAWRNLDDESKNALKTKWQDEVENKKDRNNDVLDENTRLLKELVETQKKMASQLHTVYIIVTIFFILYVISLFIGLFVD